MNIAQKILNSFQAHNLTQKGDIVIVGVSGGADSVALIHILFQLRYKLGITLHVAHFNHRLRATSDCDERFVKSVSEQLGLPFHVLRSKSKMKSKTVSEDTARQWRLEFFYSLSQKIGANSIALAHTQNDLAETVLMKILRGTGLLGLRGIRPDSKLGSMKIIRPFLSISRKDIEEYLKSEKIKFCIDETNLKTFYLRNKVRLKLLPMLIKEYNSNFPEVLIDLAETAGIDYDYIYKQAMRLFQNKVLVSQKKVSIKMSIFNKEHTSMQRMLLRLSFDHLVNSFNELSFNHIEEVEDMLLNRPVGSVVHWPKAVVVEKSNKELVLRVKSLS